MNCMDIARMADAGSFARLTHAERSAADAHALTCRHCAPVWAVHARLAELRIPRMPPELSLRCQTLAAAGARQVGRPLRRWTVIGSLAALAAAAGALTWFWGRALESAPADSVAVVVQMPASAAEQPLQPAAPEPAPALPATESRSQRAAPAEVRLPPVPEPVGRPPDRKTTSLLLQKAVERHPELVQGPQLDDPAVFVVSLAMRSDGSVQGSAAELASPVTFPDTTNRLSRILPGDAGENIASSFKKGWQLSDGSVLRAQVFLRAVLISGTYDITRSDVRVREILGTRYEELMTPPGSEEFNLVTVLLADDGRVLREKVDRVTLQNADIVMGPRAGARQEEVVAFKLGVDVEQLGLVGTTILEDGVARTVVDQTGASRVEGVRRLAVLYAWSRRTEETASIHAPRPAPPPEDFDVAAAQVVVEQILPDAFSHTPPSFADMLLPVVVFTARGEVLRAGRVHMRDGVSIDSLLQEQLVAGIHTRSHRTARLTNKAGARAVVMFAWAQ